VVEDYGVVFFGSAAFKMLRLFVITAFGVHMFACIFYRVKDNNEDQHAVIAFYESKDTAFDVSSGNMSCDSCSHIVNFS
jgi:hypothetical protein